MLQHVITTAKWPASDGARFHAPSSSCFINDSDIALPMRLTLTRIRTDHLLWKKSQATLRWSQRGRRTRAIILIYLIMFGAQATRIILVLAVLPLRRAFKRNKHEVSSSSRCFMWEHVARFLVVCSDGVWDVMSSQKAAQQNSQNSGVSFYIFLANPPCAVLGRNGKTI